MKNPLPSSHDQTNLRYSRQVLFKPIDHKGQKQIAQSHVLVIGCGALGTHFSEFLVRAGVRKISLIDRDFIEESNLQRQTLFTESDAAQSQPKALTAKKHLQAINKTVEISAHMKDFSAENAESFFEEPIDLVLDSSDNFETRFLINDICVQKSVPWIYSACVGSQAISMPVLPKKSACLHCLLEELPLGIETCDTTGIIMPAVFAALSMSSSHALKILSGNEETLQLCLQKQDCWTMQTQKISTQSFRSDCKVCVHHNFSYLSGHAQAKTIRLCGRNAIQILPRQKLTKPLQKIMSNLPENAKILAQNDFLFRIEFEKYQLTLFKDGRALVSGTQDFARAKSLYARFIGS